MNFRPPALWRTHLLTTTAALLGLWLLGWLALPWLLKPLLQQQASQALGRQVTVEAVEVYPWSLTLALRDLRVASADGTSTQLSVERASVNASLSSVLRWAPVLDAVAVVHPVLHLRHLGQGQLDVQDVLDRLYPPDAPREPDTDPPRLAIYNIELLGGELTLADGPHTHRVQDLALALPFIHTLGDAKALRQVRVQPRLSFRLNGSLFDTAAQTQPFDDSLATQATLSVTDLDLAPYLAYLPRQLPVRPTRAVLGADLRVAFHQLPTPTVTLSGHLHARDLALADGGGHTLLELDSVQATLADVRPLQRVVQLGEVTLGAPRLHLRRDASGNLLPAEKQSIANKLITPSAEGAKDSKLSAPPWHIGIQTLTVAQGQVNWQDAQVPNGAQRPARLSLNHWQAHISQLQWPLPTDAAQATRFDTSATLASGAAPTTTTTTTTTAKAKAKATAASAAAPAQLGFAGQVLASGAQARLDLRGLDLPWLAPYFATHLTPEVQGQLDLQARLTWQPAPGAASATTSPPTDELTLSLDQLSLSQLRLTPAPSEHHPRPPAAGADKLVVSGASIQPLAHRAQLGRIQVTRPQLPLHRLANGQWALEQWLTSPPATASGVNASAEHTPLPTPAPQASPPWDWQLAELTVTDGQLTWRDDTPQPPVALQASALQLSLKGLAARSTQPASLSANLTLGTANTDPGSLSWRGSLALGVDGQTPTATGQLVAKRLPVHALAPYAAGQVQLNLLRADASYAGRITWTHSPEGPHLHVTGDATLEDVNAHTLAQAATAQAPALAAEPLLRWKTLNLQGLDLQLAPAKPTRLSLDSGAMADFFARIAILPSGRINLQDTFTATATPGVPTHPPVIRMGPFSLVHGEVDFSDAYIRPNYQAHLSDLTGRLGGFASQPPPGAGQPGSTSAPAMAELLLQGRAEGTASLEISGRINPLAQPLALDIEGRVRDLELPALSPYSVKYTGHGIERGKLSLDVAYTVQPDGRLTARNQLVLNRLTFGDAVPDAPTSLPVKLAVALLADRQGVIDLNLPLQGSLNDPEFQLLPILFKIIGNLLAKAATAPFSLLASALGGDADELGSVAFVPGTAQMAPASEATLARLAQALADRPRLALTVAGTAHLATERSAYQRARLDEQLRVEQRRGASASTGTPATAPTDTGAPALIAAERQRWLAELYRRTDMPKPRNALGLPSTLSANDMQALLLAQIPVTDAAMHTLATQRALAVRDALTRLKVPAQRLFLAAPQLPSVATPGTWQPTAQLALTVP